MATLTISPLALSTYQIGFALGILAVLTPFAGIGNIVHDRMAFAGVILGLGLTGTGIAYVLYYFIVRRMGAVQASSVTYLPPVVALLIGWLLAGETLRPLALVAMAAILGGVYAIQALRSRQINQAETPDGLCRANAASVASNSDRISKLTS